MKKAILSILLTVAMFSSVSLDCYAATGYDTKSIDSYLGVCVADADDWHQVDAKTSYQPYVKRYNSKKSPQCVGYVYARLEEKLALSPSFSSGAGAKDIPSNAPNGAVRISYSTGKKYTIEVYKNDNGSHITANSWVSFGATSKNQYGHVVYVEEVIGNYIYYTEGGGSYGKVGVGTAGTLKKATKDKFLDKKGGYVGTVVFRPHDQSQFPSHNDTSTTNQNNKCAHASYNSYGKCKRCGVEYSMKISPISAATYQTVKNNVPVRNRPYSPEKITKYLSKGTIVTVVASSKNSIGNLWYQLSDGSWIYSKNLKKVTPENNNPKSEPSSIKIFPNSYPSGSLKYGKDFTLTAKFTSDCAIAEARAYLLDSNQNVIMEAKGSSTTGNYYVKGYALDKGMKFDKLSPGEYYLKYYVKDANGDTASWISEKFYIVKENNNPNTGNVIADGVYVIATKLDKNYVLDISGASEENGANLQLWESNGSPAQTFRVTHVSNGYYQIVNTNSGKAISVQNGGKTAGTNVWQYQLDHSDAQLWKIVKASGGSYYIIGKGSGLYLDVDNAYADSGTNVKIFDRNDAYDAQKWIFQAS